MGSSLITILLAVVLAVGGVGATSYVGQEVAPETPVGNEEAPYGVQYLCQALAETIDTLEKRVGQPEPVVDDGTLLKAFQTRLRAMNLVCNGGEETKVQLQFAKDGEAYGNLTHGESGLHLQIGSHQYSIGGPQGVQNGGNADAGPSDSAGSNGGDGGNGGGNGNGH